MTESSEQAKSLVFEAFDTAKISVASFNRSLKLLEKSNTYDSKAFLEVFLTCLNRILLVYTKDPKAERLINLVVKLVNSELQVLIGDNHVDLFTVITAYLIQHSSASEKSVRYRCCQILAEILQSRADDSEISEELWNAIIQSMQIRCRDRISSVRSQALRALSRMQDPYEADDPVTKTFFQLLRNDAAPNVRSTALHYIAIDQSVPLILQRTRDISEEVRIQAFSVLREKVDPRVLSIQQRITILRDGLQSRSQNVRRCCLSMLKQGWLEGSCESNLTKLVKLLDVETNEEDVIVILKALFGESDIPVIVDVNELSNETAIILKAKIAHYRECSDEASIDLFIPSLQVYCDILVYFQNQSFIARQLLDISEYLDFGDEAGRIHLTKIIKQFLLEKQLDAEIIPNLVRTWSRCENSYASFVTACSELLGELSSSEDDLADCVLGIERGLLVLKELLNIQGTRDSGSSLFSKSLLESLVQPGLVSTKQKIRLLAVECLGLFCIQDTEVAAKQHLPLFLQICSSDTEELQIVAMKTLFDVLLCAKWHRKRESSDLLDEYPANSSVSSEDTENFEIECISFLAERLTSTSVKIRTCAVEGFAKLLLTRKVSTSLSTLSCLLLLYFDPFTEEDFNLRQCLSVFFPVFVISFLDNVLLIEKCFLSVINTILDAPPSKSLSEASVTQVAEYLLYLVNASISYHKNKEMNDIYEQVRHVHERICCLLLHAIIDEPDGRKAREFSKILNFLRINMMEVQDCFRQEIKDLLFLAKEHSTVRPVISNIRRFESRIFSTNQPCETSESCNVDSDRVDCSS